MKKDLALSRAGAAAGEAAEEEPEKAEESELDVED